MRRNLLKSTGLTIGALAVMVAWITGDISAQDTGDGLGPMDPDEMRITFMGTSFLPRLSQEANSVFVECGQDGSFVFDCGSGVISKYISMGVAYSQMDKIFLTHLHGDHMSDLMFIYLFGPSADRLTDLHVWGPTGPTEEDGITSFCEHLYAMTHWHRESFSFLSTGLTNGQDGYNLVPHECSYEEAWQSIRDGHGAPVAYDSNNVMISYFPMIHDRDGAIAFKLEWRGLKMLFSGDSQPNTLMIDQAADADVLIHELTLSPEVWAQKNSGLTPDPNNPVWVGAVNKAKLIQDASHTPARAFGYILSRTNPRLGVATHFQNQSDTIGAVKDDISVFYPYSDDDDPPRVLLATDCMVITVPVDKGQPIQWRQGHGNPYAFQTTAKWYSQTELAPPKYPGNRDQLSRWLQGLIINPRIYNPVPLPDSGDYNGDGTSDLAVFRPDTGLWAVRGITRATFGSAGDIPVPGDYRGDGTTVIAIYRGSTGLWAARSVTRAYFGRSADVPIARDYNGDGTTDMAIFRGSSGLWAIRGSSKFYFGTADDIPVPGYYSGRRADIAVFRPSTGLWAIRGRTRLYFGWSTDTPVPGDYDGDGSWQPAVFPYSGGLWAVRGVTRAYFGDYNDNPAPGNFSGTGTDRIGIFRGSSGLWAVRGLTRVYFGEFEDIPATR